MIKCLFLFVLLLPVPALAQQSPSSSGKVIYVASIKLYRHAGSTDTLQFNRQASFFRWQRKKPDTSDSKTLRDFKRTHPNAKNEVMHVTSKDTIGEYVWNDGVHDSLISRYVRNETMGHNYLLKEKRPAIRWTIADSTKMIGGYRCTKATGRFRGRFYTAWFAPKIPVPYGPWKLQGLPGLILQAHDQVGKISFKVQKLSFANDVRLPQIPRTGQEKVIGLTEYKQLLTHMKKMMRRHLREEAIKTMHKIKAKGEEPNLNLEEAQITVRLPDNMETMEKFESSTGH